jgi:hypothetical protein
MKSRLSAAVVDLIVHKEVSWNSISMIYSRCHKEADSTRFRMSDA